MKRLFNIESPAKICCILLVFAIAAFATQARIEGMGKRPAFFLDDMTMFDNPANATFYPDILIGELGFYSQEGKYSLNSYNVGKSHDPFNSWFGGLFKFELSDQDLRDPQITIGGFFGREHYEFTRFIPRMVNVGSDSTPNLVPTPRTITNFDGFLAGTMIDGSAVGVHVYVGVQDGKQDSTNELSANAHTSILAMDYGANFLVTNQSSVEISVGIARIQYGPSRKTFLDPGLFSFYSQGRMFIESDLWSGQFITGYKIAAMEVPGWTENLYDMNVGFNVMIPRGLFWFGLDAVHVKESVDTWDKVSYTDSEGKEDSYLIYRVPGSREKPPKDMSDRIGGVLSFGIERNVWSNWLVMRAGGQKSFVYNKCINASGKKENAPVCEYSTNKGGKSNYWTTNPFGDGSLDDHLGFGIGLNIDNKLKVDATISEDALFRNPFIKGAQATILSRISATYSF